MDICSMLHKKPILAAEEINKLSTYYTLYDQ